MVNKRRITYEDVEAIGLPLVRRDVLRRLLERAWQRVTESAPPRRRR